MSYMNVTALNITRKLAPAFFLVIFSLPVTGTYFLFKIRQSTIHKNIRKYMEDGLDESQLVLLKIPLSEELNPGLFERTEENEFKFKGNMFDVVKSERHQDTTWYWCVWDKDETALEKAFEEEKRRTSSQEGKNPDDIMKAFLKLLFINTTELTLILPVKDVITVNCFRIDKNSDLSFTPPSPPPKPAAFAD